MSAGRERNVKGIAWPKQRQRTNGRLWGRIGHPANHVRVTAHGRVDEFAAVFPYGPRANVSLAASNFVFSASLVLGSNAKR